MYLLFIYFHLCSFLSVYPLHFFLYVSLDVIYNYYWPFLFQNEIISDKVFPLLFWNPFLWATFFALIRWLPSIYCIAFSLEHSFGVPLCLSPYNLDPMSSFSADPPVWQKLFGVQMLWVHAFQLLSLIPPPISESLGVPGWTGSLLIGTLSVLLFISQICTEILFVQKTLL